MESLVSSSQFETRYSKYKEDRLNHYVLTLTSALRRNVKCVAVNNVVAMIDPGATVHIFGGGSDISEQPEEYDETLQGARNRAKKSKQRLPRCYAIGSESGIRWKSDHWEDWTVSVMLDPRGVEHIVESIPVTVPTAYVEEARKRGFKTTTVGKVMSEILGTSATDPHSFLTNGRLSRREILEMSFMELLTRQRKELAS